MKKGNVVQALSQVMSFLAMISSFHFIITRHIFYFTLPVTHLLQAKNNDILDGIEFIQTLKNLVNTARNMIDYYHGQWYSEALTLAAEIKVDVSLPRTCSRDVPASDASEYYKHTLTIPVLDHLNSDLQTKFDVSSVNAIYGLSIIPSKRYP